MKKTILQLAVLVFGILGFALLLDAVIDLADEIPPIAGDGTATDPPAERAVPLPEVSAIRATMLAPGLPQGQSVPQITAKVRTSGIDPVLPALLPAGLVPPAADPVLPPVAPPPAPLPDPSSVQYQLDAMRDYWLTVRHYEGRDYLYATSLMAFRCGLTEIRYGVNGAKPATAWPMEPCYPGTQQPNAMVDIIKYPSYLTFPPGSIMQASIAVTFADGSTDVMHYDRNQIFQP